MATDREKKPKEASQPEPTLPVEHWRTRLGNAVRDNPRLRVMAIILLGVIAVIMALIVLPGSGGDDNPAPAANESPPAVLDDGDPAVAEVPVDDPAEAEAAVEEVAAQLIASAAGVYRLQEASVRPLIESDGTLQFESADGAIVIEPNGEVSGDLNYVMWGPFDNARARITADVTIKPAPTPMLEPTNLGLAFEGTLVVSFLTEPPDRPAYTNPPSTQPVTGLVQPESGLLKLTFARGEGDDSTFDFLR